MKLRFAVLSFCPDLTNPREASQPVAVAGTGRLDESGAAFWFYVVGSTPAAGSTYDDVSRDMLNSLPMLLQRQMLEATNVKPDGFLEWLHDRFRNSLHVSAIEDRQDAISDIAEAPSVVIRLYLDRVGRAPTKQAKPLQTMPKLHVEPFVPFVAQA
jgi:hypothetical protein